MNEGPLRTEVVEDLYLYVSRLNNNRYNLLRLLGKV